MPTFKVNLSQDIWTKVATGPCRVSTAVRGKDLGFIAQPDTAATPNGTADFEPWQQYVNYGFEEAIYINPFRTGISFVTVTTAGA